MLSPTLVATLLREVFGPRRLSRTPEPDLVMNGEDVVRAHTLVGRVQGPVAAAHLFHAARISMVIRGSKHVFDLACGPANQLCLLAQLNPEIEFTGVDLSDGMLENARAYVRHLGLKNVNFLVGDITRLDFIPDQSADAVISTVALHHLPTTDHLRRTFREINRILDRNGALYLADFGRLKSAKSVRFFAYKDRDTQPEVFCRDYENSLRAAFLIEEFTSLAREELPSYVHVKRTFAIPFFMLVKSEDRPIDEALRRVLKRKRLELEPRYRVDLDDIRRFFRMGGLPNDPFH
jgi:ubiquinone/menaquinone biosynthesis C-methylase UbiE